MLYTKLILGAVVILLIIYYIMVVGQLCDALKFTNRQIKFKKLVIPFYYWVDMEKKRK